MMSAIMNASALDYSFDEDGKLLYSFYTQSKIVEFAGNILNSTCEHRNNTYFSIARILSNIALSNVIT